MTKGFPEKGTVDVLLVTYGGGHVQMVLPVAQELVKRGKRIAVFALTTAISAFEKTGLRYFSYEDLPQAQTGQAQSAGARLMGNVDPNGPVSPAESRAYHGLNFLELEQQLGKEAAQARYDEMGRASFFPETLMKEVLADVQPAVVVATNSPRTERAAIEAARDLKIPALCMVDMFALQEIAWIKHPDFADTVCVLNPAVRDMFVTNGRRPENLVVTGNPAFDLLHAPETLSSGQNMRHERGWGSNGRCVVLFASTPEAPVHPFTGVAGDPTFPQRIETKVRAILAQRTDVDLVLRRHPSEEQFVETSAFVHHSPRSDDINSLLHAVDIVIVTVSTVGLQGHLAGRPVITVSGSIFDSDAPFADFGMATAVHSETELLHVLNQTIKETSSAAPFPARARQSATSNVTYEILSLLDGLAPASSGSD